MVTALTLRFQYMFSWDLPVNSCNLVPMTVIHLRHLTASVSSFSLYILQSGDTSCFSMNANDSSSLSSFPYSFKSSTNSRWLVDSPSLPNMHLALYFLRTIDRDIKQNSDSKKQSAWNMPRRILTSPRARPLAVCIVFQFCFPWWHVEHLEGLPIIFSVSKIQQYGAMSYALR